MLVLIRMGQGGSHLAGASAGADRSGGVIGDRTADRYWRAGILYINRDDPAVFVEKRFGGGYTMNMARPAAWLLLGAVLVVVLLAPWLAGGHH